MIGGIDIAKEMELDGSLESDVKDALFEKDSWLAKQKGETKDEKQGGEEKEGDVGCCSNSSLFQRENIPAEGGVGPQFVRRRTQTEGNRAVPDADAQ